MSGLATLEARVAPSFSLAPRSNSAVSPLAGAAAIAPEATHAADHAEFVVALLLIILPHAPGRRGLARMCGGSWLILSMPATGAEIQRLGDRVCLSRIAQRRKKCWCHLEKSFLLKPVPMRCATCLVVWWEFGTMQPKYSRGITHLAGLLDGNFVVAAQINDHLLPPTRKNCLKIDLCVLPELKDALPALIPARNPVLNFSEGGRGLFRDSDSRFERDRASARQTWA